MIYISLNIKFDVSLIFVGVTLEIFSMYVWSQLGLHGEY